jgi:hypothetical protein
LYVFLLASSPNQPSTEDHFVAFVVPVTRTEVAPVIGVVCRFAQGARKGDASLLLNDVVALRALVEIAQSPEAHSEKSCSGY